MAFNQLKTIAKNLLVYVWSRLLPSNSETEIDPAMAESQRLTEIYGSLWPEKCGPLPPDWFDTLPEWAFRGRDGILRPRDKSIEKMKSIHIQRIKSHRKKYY